MTEARKLAVSIIVVLVALAGVGTWLVLGLRQAGRLEKSIAEKGGELSMLQGKIADVPRLHQERQKLGSELDEYEAILPNDREINKILDTLSEYQKKAGLEITVFTPVREKTDARAAATTYKKVSYDLDLKGDYVSFIRFLNLLENHNRFIQVDTFSMKQKDETSLINEITVKLSTFVYDSKAKAAPSARASKPGATAKAGASSRRPASTKAAPELPFELPKELVARFVYAGDSVRDPFTNPLTPRVNVAALPGVKEAPKNLMSPDQERALLDDAEKKLQEAESLVAQDKLEDAAKLLGETQLVTVQPFRDTALAQRATALGREWQRLDHMASTARGERVYRAVEGTYEKMLQAFEKDQYDEVLRLRATLDVVVGKDLLGLKSPEAGGKDGRGKAAAPKAAKTVPDAAPAPEERDAMHERLVELVKACDALAMRAGVRREFSLAGIQIQGTFWSGRGAARKAAAIINGQMLNEGEALKRDAKAVRVSKFGEPPADIVVQRIDREKVTFAYKSELIEKSTFKTD